MEKYIEDFRNENLSSPFLFNFSILGWLQHCSPNRFGYGYMSWFFTIFFHPQNKRENLEENKLPFVDPYHLNYKRKTTPKRNFSIWIFCLTDYDYHMKIDNSSYNELLPWCWTYPGLGRGQEIKNIMENETLSRD